MENIAVIFDMDGVLVNNTNYHIKAWEELCKRYDIIWDKEVYLKNINGRPIKEGLSSLFKNKLSEEEINNLSYEKDALYREVYKNDIVPLQGLIFFLEHLLANNIPRAIATSANILNVDFTLDGIGVRRYFDTILDEKSASKGKPDPEIYLKAAKALQVDPSQCVVFEDSFAGIISATSAGMKVVGLATTHPAEKLVDAQMVRENFSGLTINTLKSLFI